MIATVERASGDGRAGARFLDRQARAWQIDPVDDGSSGRGLRLRAGARWDLPRHLYRTVADVAFGDRVETSPEPGTDVLTVLALAAGITRYEPRNSYNCHRATPSARSCMAAEVLLRTDAGCWRFDPARHALVSTGDPNIEPDLRAGVDIVVVANTAALPPWYEDLRWSLALLESGHLLATLSSVCAVLRLDHRVALRFPDAATLATVGLAGDDAALPAALLTIRGGAARPFDPAGLPVGSDDPVVRFDRSGWVEDELLGADIPIPSGRQLASRSWEQVLFERSAGRVNKGFSCSTRPLPAGVVGAVASSVSGMWLPGVTGATVDPSLRVHLVVERVDQLATGVYLVRPDGQLEWRFASAGMADVASCFPYNPSLTDLSSASIAVVVSSPVAEGFARGGARAARYSQIAAGAHLQRMSLAAADAEVFLRPLRSFDPDALGSVVRADDGSLPVYAGVAGRTRFVDLLLDVRA
ncbi:MAG: hypothetical protein ACRCYX_10705 [Dermatophilaceae bacterium]